MTCEICGSTVWFFVVEIGLEAAIVWHVKCAEGHALRQPPVGTEFWILPDELRLPIVKGST
jgi:hypothetical protein